MGRQKLSNTDLQQILISPVTGGALQYESGNFNSDDGVVYPIEDGIIDLLDERLVDETLRLEFEAFENMPIENVCYFRASLFEEIIGNLKPILDRVDIPKVCVELGGGEGYFADNYARLNPGSNAIVFDLSKRQLGHAPSDLIRIRADMRYEIFKPGSIGLVVFWVSLHHLNEPDCQSALAAAAHSLADGGVMLIFEPNNEFLPRRLFYSMRLSKQVYFDDEEKALEFDNIAADITKCNLTSIQCIGVNPPYAFPFLRYFAAWPFFLLITEGLYRFNQVAKIFCKSLRLDTEKRSRFTCGLSIGSYFCAIFQKRSGF